MNYLDDPLRERIIEKALNAYTPAEIEEAIALLREWLEKYPEDWGIRDAFEPLSALLDAQKETSESELESADTTRAVAKQGTAVSGVGGCDLSEKQIL